MSGVAVLSCSLRPGSHSRILAVDLVKHYLALGVTPTFIDLCDLPLPLCDGKAAYDDPNVGFLAGHLQAAKVIMVASPVYNFDVNAAAKNVVELTGSAWEEKIVGFLCAAGGSSSYMSVMGLANSLMLDFRSLIIPRFVYAVSSDFKDGHLTSDKIRERIKQLAETSLHIRY